MKNISCLQHQYTSCRYGLSGYPGFQTHAMSKDILPEDQRSIEKLGLYQPPRDCMLEPNQDDIEDSFPIAYRNTYLESGSLLIVRSVYVGLDYSNRWGNYFAHTLLFQELPNDIWPVDLYEWKGWINELRDEEDTQQTDLDLPRIHFSPSIQAYSLEDLSEFLKDNDQRQDALAKMIQAVFSRKKTSRSVVIREETNMDGLFWIACIQKCFPSNVQKDLSCSSYQFDPRSCLAVNAVYGETDFSLGENERDFQFYVFDFLNGDHSNIEQVGSEYANAISAWMCVAPSKLVEFHLFSLNFNLTLSCDSLLPLYRLYLLRTGECKPLVDEQLVEILDFVTSSTKKECFEGVVETVVSSIGQITAINKHWHNDLLAAFFLKGFESSSNDEIKDAAYNQLLILLDRVIMDRTFSEAELEALFVTARSICNRFDTEFSILFLSQAHLSAIDERIPTLDGEALSAIIDQLINSISSVGTELMSDARFLAFIRQSLLANIDSLKNSEWLFSNFEKSPESISKLCICACSILNRLEVQEEIISETQFDNAINSLALQLTNIFLNKGDEYYYKATNLIKQNAEAYPLLERQWKNEISKQKHKADFHEKYYQHVLSEGRDFDKKHHPDFAEELWKLISPSDRIDLAIEWIETNHILTFSKASFGNSEEFFVSVFNSASNAVSFVPNDTESDELAELIRTKAEHLNIGKTLDRLELRSWILSANSDSKPIGAESVELVRRALSSIEKVEYRKFISNYLPLMLAKVRTIEQHRRVILSALIVEYQYDFLKSYKSFLGRGRSDQFSFAESKALGFWISINRRKDDEGYKQYQEIRMKAKSLLAARIAKLKDEDIQKLVNVCIKGSLLDDGESLQDIEEKELISLFEEVEKRKRTLLRRIVQQTKKSWRLFGKRK